MQTRNSFSICLMVLGALAVIYSILSGTLADGFGNILLVSLGVGIIILGIILKYSTEGFLLFLLGMIVTIVFNVIAQKTYPALNGVISYVAIFIQLAIYIWAIVYTSKEISRKNK